jgi:serine/threonine protein kinase
VDRLTKDSVIDDRYRIVRRVGKGGMGSVYEAIDAHTGARVAVKVITAEAAANETRMSRFAREAEAAAAIDTPHIVRVLGSGRDEAHRLPYLVMEYLEGEDLHQLIKRLGPLAPDLALRVAAQACLGLQRAHEMRIVHRDIKPANFFLARADGGERVVKLLDFGVAKIKSDPTANTAETAGLTRTGSMLGSPLYMSPEQARGHRDLDQRSDIWSFGVVLYQALCGHTPHRDTDLLGELLILICTEAPEPLQQVAPWVAPELASLVHRALRFNAGERFQTAGELRAAITALLPGDTTIHEHLLQPLDPRVRGSVAPLVTESLHDAPAPRRTLGSSIAETRSFTTGGGSAAAPPPPYSAPGFPSAPGGAPVGGTITSGGAFGTTVGRGGESAPPSMHLVPPPRSPSTLLVGMAGVSLLLAGAVAAYVLARPPTVVPANANANANVSATATATEPTAAPLKTRTVRLVIIPDDATVEIEGAKVQVKDGLVEIKGALGSVHAVHVKSGDDETTSNVVVTEDGALPPKIELRPSAAKPLNGKTAPRVPGPLPTAKPVVVAAPPSDFRTGR